MLRFCTSRLRRHQRASEEPSGRCVVVVCSRKSCTEEKLQQTSSARVSDHSAAFSRSHLTKGE